VRESPRAKRVSLRVLPPDGVVEVLVPLGHDHTIASLAVDSHHSWIVKQQLKMAASTAVGKAKQKRPLPKHIHLAAIDMYLAVEYHPVKASCSIAVSVDAPSRLLHVVGNVSDERLVFSTLHKYLKLHGKDVLPVWLWKLVKLHGGHHALHPNRVTVRLQQSRWGSCSAKGNISLNAKLLLLPPALVDHVMLHELAHLRVHNHSQHYWDFLSLLDPHWQQRKAELHQLETKMPSWIGKV